MLSSYHGCAGELDALSILLDLFAFDVSRHSLFDVQAVSVARARAPYPSFGSASHCQGSFLHSPMHFDAFWRRSTPRLSSFTSFISKCKHAILPRIQLESFPLVCCDKNLVHFTML